MLRMVCMVSSDGPRPLPVTSYFYPIKINVLLESDRIHSRPQSSSLSVVFVGLGINLK